MFGHPAEFKHSCLTIIIIRCWLSIKLPDRTLNFWQNDYSWWIDELSLCLPLKTRSSKLYHGVLIDDSSPSVFRVCSAQSRNDNLDLSLQIVPRLICDRVIDDLWPLKVSNEGSIFSYIIASGKKKNYKNISSNSVSPNIWKFLATIVITAIT